MQADARFAANWATVKVWSEVSAIVELMKWNARALRRDRRILHGVLPWLRTQAGNRSDRTGRRAIEAISAAGLDVSIAYWGRLADSDQYGNSHLGTPYVVRHALERPTNWSTAF